jgi:glucosylceramidase
MMIGSRVVSIIEVSLLLLCCAGVCRADVEVWLTKGDGTVKLERQPDLTFVPGPGQSLERRVAVHEERKEQVIDGFGAALTDSSAWLISGLHERRRWELLTRLFSRDGNGIGLSCLRVPIGSSDFSLTAYTYEDEPGITEDYSEYLVNFIKAYEHEGVPIHAITLQNEPCHEDVNLPSMRLDWVDLVNIVVYDLVDRFAKEAITTDIILYDHNWDNVEYALKLLADLQLNHNRHYQVIAGTAFHCYGGTPASQSGVHDVHPDKDIYFTECTGWHYQDQGPDDGGIAN